MSERENSKLHQLEVAEIRQLTDDAVSITVAVPARLSAEFEFVPGQYLTLQAQIDGEAVRRTYSICSAVGEPLRVGVKHLPDGVFSRFAAEELRVGDRLLVLPPQGRFTAVVKADARRDYLLIAAGSGITPILSIARSLLEGEAASNVTLVYGNKRSSSIMFLDDIEALKDRFLSRFRVLHVLSRETQDVELFHGRIDGARIAAFSAHGLIAPADADAIYLCGPPAMCDDIIVALLDCGVDEARLRRELFTQADGSLPVAPSEAVHEAVSDGVRVEVVLDGARKRFSIESADDSVLAAAAKAGLDLPFSCAGGMCATCRCKVIEGRVEMQANYSLQPWELEAGYVLACQSRSVGSKLVLDFDAV